MSEQTDKLAKRFAALALMTRAEAALNAGDGALVYDLLSELKEKYPQEYQLVIEAARAEFDRVAI